jgi:RNA polymerase sigma-70 factor (ECF subfamily)
MTDGDHAPQGPTDERSALEAPIQAAWQGQDFGQATTLAIETYGEEVMGFLIARTKSPSDASDIFSMFAEDLWRGLPAFEWRCSLRGWCYTLARHAIARHVRSPHNRADRNLALSQHGALSALVDRLRSTTHAFARTEAKDRVRALRERLPEDDQTLLILRVDRNLSWRELALVMNDAAAPGMSEAELQKAEQRLRQRFKRVKDRLKELAKEAGLL